jgi:hypothetical protein
MDNPGTAQNNFLSSRGSKQAADSKIASVQSSSTAMIGNPQGLALYFSLMKNKKMPDLKKPAYRSKQVVMRSPSSQDRQSERSDTRLSQVETSNKENLRRIGNIAKFTASKILFQDEKRGKK